MKPKENCMTMTYYVKRLLPVYAKYIHETRLNVMNCILQEDNDSSHGTRDTKKSKIIATI